MLDMLFVLLSSKILYGLNLFLFFLFQEDILIQTVRFQPVRKGNGRSILYYQGEEQTKANVKISGFLRSEGLLCRRRRPKMYPPPPFLIEFITQQKTPYSGYLNNNFQNEGGRGISTAGRCPTSQLRPWIQDYVEEKISSCQLASVEVKL